MKRRKGRWKKDFGEFIKGDFMLSNVHKTLILNGVEWQRANLDKEREREGGRKEREKHKTKTI